MRPKLMTALAFALLATSLAGCRQGKIYPVKGRIVYADTLPANDLAGYRVEFESIDGKIDDRSASAEGEIQQDGTFQITTIKPNDGALLGKHKVIITPPVPEGDTPAKPYVIHPKYLSYETTDLTVTVEPGANDITLTIERRPK